MKAEIISIGSKYVVGEASTDCIKAISVKLSALGIEVANQQSVPAESDELSSALKTALLRNDIVFTVGALGVLSTDITVETVCSAIGRKLVYMPSLEKKIDSIYAERGDVMPESDLKLAIVPDNSIVLDGKQDIIPGLIIKADGKCIIMLPEKLSELKYMMDGQVASELAEYCPPVASKAYNVFGINETQIRTRLGRMGDSINPRFSYYPSIGETKIVISATAENGKTADDLLCDAESHVKIKLDSFIYSEEDVSLQQTVVDELQKRGEKIATAESCTAGLLSKFITDVPGSSVVFDMGVSTYSAKMKEQLLGVSKSSIEKYGEVSPETACEMAAGVRLRSGADYGIGITGVAGPESQEGKPVGMVYVAVADSRDIHAIVLKLGNQSREYIREYSAKTALDMVRRVIIGLGNSLGRSVSTASVEKKLTTVTTENVSEETAKSDNLTGLPNTPIVMPPVPPVVPIKPEVPSASVPQVTPPEELMADLPKVDDLSLEDNETVATQADSNAEIQPEGTDEEISGFEINSNVLDDEQFAPKGLPTIAELEAAAAAASTTEAAERVIASEPIDEAADDFKVGVESLEQSDFTESAELPEQTDVAASDESGEAVENSEKKLPWFKRFLFWFVPQKGDGKYAIVKIVRLILIAVLIVSLTMIISYYRDLYNAGNIQSKLPPHDATNTEMVTLDDGRQILANMKPYYDLNSDTVGYLTIKDIDATGPVVWRKNDNDYYLHYDFEKKKNRFGSRFADGRDVFGEDGSMSKNTTIYGHYSDETVIFGELNKYQDQTFFKEHSTIQFSTLYQQKDYKVFAVFITNASGSDVFDYTLPEFASDEEFIRFTNRVKHRTIINTGVDIQPTDSLLTLSTCSRIFKDARLVVVARAVRPGEDPNQDLNAISVNPTPLYPDIWYREVDPKAVKPIFDDETSPVEVTTEPTTVPTTETTTVPTTEASTVTITLPTAQTPQVVQQPPQIQTVISYVTVPAPTTTTQPKTKAPTTTKKPTSPPQTTQPTVTEPAQDGDDNQSSPNKHPEE